MDDQERGGSDPTVEMPITRLTPSRRLSDLTAPATVEEQLRELVALIRARERGGLAALFTGSSGTGKTMAIEALAGELDVDLFRMDVSRVVGKYIGETEKNLDRVFGEAERANAVLYFDEADALFGKRSEVKDAHDRYANLKVDYLLQRIEEHPGVVILASNVRPDADEAFLPHLDRIIEFTRPG
jgi:SpoVK/Ycf46/Vps4 family AAA+-type ATPase